MLIVLYLSGKGVHAMDLMNVNSALSAAQSYSSVNSVSSAVSVKMLDKALDMNESLNDSMLKMMENSVTPYLGGNFDMSV